MASKLPAVPRILVVNSTASSKEEDEDGFRSIQGEAMAAAVVSSSGRLTSLCPVVGQRFFVPMTGTICPADGWSISGKNIMVSFVGIGPYIVYSEPPTGTDFLIMDIFSKKYDFTYDISPERSYDWRTFPNGTGWGVIFKVRWRLSRRRGRIFTIKHFRLPRVALRWVWAS